MKRGLPKKLQEHVALTFSKNIIKKCKGLAPKSSKIFNKDLRRKPEGIGPRSIWSIFHLFYTDFMKKCKRTGPRSARNIFHRFQLGLKTARINFVNCAAIGLKVK